MDSASPPHADRRPHHDDQTVIGRAEDRLEMVAAKPATPSGTFRTFARRG